MQCCILYRFSALDVIYTALNVVSTPRVLSVELCCAVITVHRVASVVDATLRLSRECVGFCVVITEEDGSHHVESRAN